MVFGCGTIGIAAAIALQYFGLEKVMICDLSSFRLSIAQKLGFATCNLSTDDFDKAARQYFGEAHSLNGLVPNVDCYIDASGAESILELFMQTGKIESRLVNVAVNKSLRTLDMLHLTYASQSIIGSGGYMPEDVEDAVKNCLKEAADSPKGYAPGAGCQIPLGTPRENLHAFCAAVEKYTRHARIGQSVSFLCQE